MIKSHFVALMLVFALIGLPGVFASLNSVEQLLRPFEYLDLSRTYDSYSGIIDMFIYTLIFIGMARVGLEKRFPGRSGKILCVGVGLALASGMAVAEHKLGFSVRSFGPAAALFLMLVLGIMLFQLLRYAGMTNLHAVAFAYAAVFLTLLGIAPTFFSWIGEKSPFFSASLSLLLILSLGSLVSVLWPSRLTGREIDREYHRALTGDPMLKWDREAVGKEKRFLKKRLRPATKNTAARTKDVGNDLDDILQEIRRHGNDPQKTPSVVNSMRKAAPKIEALKKQTRDLRKLHERLRRYDATLFSRKSQERLSEMPPEARSLLAKEMKHEVDRLDVEKKIDRIETTYERHLADLMQHLREAASALQSGQPGRAYEIVKKAKASQKACQDLAEFLRRLEDYLLGLVKSDIRIESKL